MWWFGGEMWVGGGWLWVLSFIFVVFHVKCGVIARVMFTLTTMEYVVSHSS